MSADDDAAALSFRNAHTRNRNDDDAATLFIVTDVATKNDLKSSNSSSTQGDNDIAHSVDMDDSLSDDSSTDSELGMKKKLTPSSKKDEKTKKSKDGEDKELKKGNKKKIGKKEKYRSISPKKKGKKGKDKLQASTTSIDEGSFSDSEFLADFGDDADPDHTRKKKNYKPKSKKNMEAKKLKQKSPMKSPKKSPKKKEKKK